MAGVLLAGARQVASTVFGPYHDHSASRGFSPEAKLYSSLGLGWNTMVFVSTMRKPGGAQAGGRPGTPTVHLPHAYYLDNALYGEHHLHHQITSNSTSNTFFEDNWLVSRTALREGWVGDPEGKYRLWIPFEWRTPACSAGWFGDTMTPLLELSTSRTTIFAF